MTNQPPDASILIFFGSLSALGLFGFVTIFLYLRSSFRLVASIEEKHPKLWHELAAPRKTYVRGSGRGFHTVQPLFPFLAWVIRGTGPGLDGDVSRLFKKVRILLFAGLSEIAAFLVLFVLLARSVE